MEEMKPTPRPWKIYRCEFAGEQEACGFNGESFDMCREECHHTVPLADAELIVSAVNQSDHVKILVEASKKALYELNAIRARDGVPYCYDGIKSGVDENYFSSVVDGLRSALAEYHRATEGK